MRRRSGVALAALLAAGCSTPHAPRDRSDAVPRTQATARAGDDDAPKPPAVQGVETGPPRFSDVAVSVGLVARHEAGRRGGFALPEIMGSGAALLDCDGDGDLDALLVGGAPSAGGRHRLFRQGDDGRFVDLGDGAGLASRGHGMGVAVGDVDADGDVDVLITHVGPDALFRNDGDCTFTDVTEASGIDNPDWGTSAVFFDHDGDSDLDLFVTNYVVFDAEVRCESSTRGRDYCAPSAYEPTSDRLFRNAGDGTFVDASVESGIASARGPGLGVAVLDLDGDGWDDLLVANDGAANFAWINRRDGTFAERAVALGLSHDAHGHVEAGMGVAVGDVDGDGGEEVLMSHLRWETNTLYRRSEGGAWRDATAHSGLGPPSHARTGFGTVMLDADHDGRLDIAVVNGSVTRGSSAACSERPDDIAACHGEPDQLFVNEGAGRFRALSLAPSAVAGSSRGLAAGDFDRDGDLDLLVSEVDGAARLLRNDSPKRGRSLIVRAVERGVDSLGATVSLRVGASVVSRRVRAGGSYLSSASPSVHYGLGPSAVEPQGTRIEGIEVVWPDGAIEAFDPAAVVADGLVLLHRGEGVTPPQASPDPRDP